MSCLRSVIERAGTIVRFPIKGQGALEIGSGDLAGELSAHPVPPSRSKPAAPVHTGRELVEA